MDDGQLLAGVELCKAIVATTRTTHSAAILGILTGTAAATTGDVTEWSVEITQPRQDLHHDDFGVLLGDGLHALQSGSAGVIDENNNRRSEMHKHKTLSGDK